MANRKIAGFEQDNLTSLSVDWAVTGTVTVPSTGRRATNCIRTIGSSKVAIGLPGHNTYHVGFAFLLESATSNLQRIARMPTPSGGLALYRDANGHLSIANEAATVLWTGGSIIAPGVWYYFEWSTYMHFTSGTTAVYINGLGTPDAAVFTGATKYAAGYSDQINQFNWGEASGSNQVNFRVGDFYANDGSGSAPDNARWGDTKVIARLATGDGDLSQLTTITPAAANHEEVDDNGAFDTGTYVYGESGVDLYTFPALDFLTSTIRASSIRVTALKEDASARTVAGTTKSGGVTNTHTAVALGTSYSVVSFLDAVDPDTGVAWTQEGLEAAQFGVTVA